LSAQEATDRQVGGAAERPVRVRIAPSPTGFFHVGTARTALYNLCVARRAGGVFIVRIEDTDRQRHDEAQIEGILSALRWLQIDWDEGPFRQSERTDLYAGAADQLWDSGHLYACDCTRQQVEERTKGKTPGYDGFCRNRGLERGPRRVLRFRVPDEGTTIVDDVIRGRVEFANATIEDFIIVKSNGDALFVLAVVVDDRQMEISHILRGEEHLPTTPKAVLLWEALNATSPSEARELPRFAHLPILVNADRQKISKRRGERLAVEDYRQEGHLPEALGNYVALLGWSFEDGRELFTREEMIEAFRLEDVVPSPAFFDNQKLLHFNGTYIRALDVADFTERCRIWAAETDHALGTAYFDTPEWAELAPLVQERVTTLSEVPGYVDFLFGDFAIEEASWDKAVGKDEAAGAILAEVRAGYGALADQGWEAKALKEILEAVATAHDRRLGKAQAPVRVATLGRTVGLPLFESLQVLGQEESLRRIDAALAQLRG
jgi:glutamyl-tRNA synthetase